MRTSPLENPYGIGINLQIEVPDVNHLHSEAVEAGAKIHIPMEERWYRQGVEEAGNRQFVLVDPRSEEHTSELQSLMRISYAVFCLKKKTKNKKKKIHKQSSIKHTSPRLNQVHTSP